MKLFPVIFCLVAAVRICAAGEQLDLGDGVILSLASVPAGTFPMGSPADSPGAANDEWNRDPKTNPAQREVTISKSFLIGTHEITQEQYQQVTGTNPSAFKDPKNPVDTISWNDAMKFCELASAKTGKIVRLPTEAEWEYACRGGAPTRFFFGEDSDFKQLGEYAWYEDNSERHTHPVGRKKPNSLGLFDMAGNVWEWCSDFYRGPFEDKTATDPQGAPKGETRILRGGCWESGPLSCRSANRGGVNPERATSRFGFRVVVEKN